jgi:DNA-binding MarR family transcriptional regulator
VCRDGIARKITKTVDALIVLGLVRYGERVRPDDMLSPVMIELTDRGKAALEQFGRET